MNEHLFQTEWWGRVKGEFGWESDLCTARSVRVFRRRIGPVGLAYVPYAFDRSEPDASDVTIREAVSLLREIGSAPGAPTHLVRWDVPWELDRFPRDEALQAGLQPAPVRVQPPDTVVLGLAPGEETVLAGMKRKTRYNIRLAGKRGVEVTRITTEDTKLAEGVSAWYRIYQETARRDRIGIHRESYYRRVMELARLPGSPNLVLYLAHHANDLLAGIIVGSWNGISTYMYGAGANIKRNLMASYLLQWEAIRDAITRGDRWYDFFGIPPTDDPSHAMYGLYRFKTGFGGRILRRPGAWDLPVSPATARIFRGVERIRRWYHADFRKTHLRKHRVREVS